MKQKKLHIILPSAFTLVAYGSVAVSTVGNFVAFHQPRSLPGTHSSALYHHLCHWQGRFPTEAK